MISVGVTLKCWHGSYCATLSELAFFSKKKQVSI